MKHMSVTHYEELYFQNKLNHLLESEIKDWASNSFGDREFLLALIKAISLSVPQIETAIPWSEPEILNDSMVAKKTLKEALQLLMRNAVTQSATPTLELHGYSTGELAKYFGVSQTTINKWIEKGRFEGVQREATNKQVRISGETWFTSSTGVRYQVKEVVTAWEQEQAETTAIPKVTEAEFIAKYLEHFRNKYGGDYEETLGIRQHEWTDEEETDASMWSFFRERYLNGPK